MHASQVVGEKRFFPDEFLPSVPAPFGTTFSLKAPVKESQ